MKFNKKRKGKRGKTRNTIQRNAVKSSLLQLYKIYEKFLLNMPEWARPTIQKLVDKGYLCGNEKGELDLTLDALRMYVTNDRAGLYDLK